MNKNKSFTCASLIFLLTACGGGSSSSDDTATANLPIDSAPIDTAPVDTSPIDTSPIDTSPIDTAPVNTDSELLVVLQSDVSAIEGSVVSLNADIMTDIDEQTLAYEWVVNSDVDITITNQEANNFSFIAPFSEGDDVIFTLSVNVTDAQGQTSSSTSTVTVYNDLPSVSFVDSVSAFEKQTVNLASLISTYGVIETYQWSMTEFTDDALIANEGEAMITVPALTEDISAMVTLTVTDQDGDSASATTELKALQIFDPLTISGLITDGPIKNSNIIIDIGSRQINAQANENGEYSAFIKIDDDETDAIIKVTGLGVGEQANAALVSVLGMADDLLEQAGNDSVLNNDENFAVNVTHITTARYGLMLYENNGDAIENKKILNELSSKVDFNQTMKIANAIKLVIDYSDDVSGLPSGIVNTLSLVENIPVALNYVNTLSVSETLYEDAYNKTLNDKNAIQTPSFDMPESLHWFISGVPNYSVPIWQFYNNNEGSYAGNVFTWQVSGNVISGNYTSPIIETNTEKLSSSVGPVAVNYQEIPTRFVLTVVSDNNGLVEFVHNRTVTRIYDSNAIEAHGIEDPSGEYTFINGHSSYRNNARQNIVDLRGKVAYLPIKKLQVNNNKGILTISADKYSFAEDGTGTMQYSGKAFTWSQTNDSVIINTETDGGSETATISLFEDESHVGTCSFNLANSDENDITTLGGIVEGDNNWNIEEITGVYESTFKSRENTLSHLWFELKENGDADTYATNDNNGDGVISADELYQAYGKWNVEGNKVTITRIVRVNTEESSPNHRVPDGIEWQQYHERTWELIAKDNNRYGILNKHNFTVGLAFPQTYRPEVAEVIYEIRLLEKLNNAPVDISHLLQ